MGILGGTFNPPHLGHLALAGAARAQLSLDRVALMPAHLAPHKRGEEDPGPEHRLRMCELAVEEAPGLCACGLELARAAPSYTVDTLSAIHESHPELRLTFILGADTACTLASWREPARLLELARLAVAPRSGSPRERVLDVLDELLGAPGSAAARVSLLEMEPIEISSSAVRTSAAQGQPLEPLVGARVAAYIERHALYASVSGVPS